MIRQLNFIVDIMYRDREGVGVECVEGVGKVIASGDVTWQGLGEGRRIENTTERKWNGHMMAADTAKRVESIPS